MAALQTLRNKPALLMSVIGGALLLFIVTLTDLNSCSRPNVEAEVNGQELTYENYEAQVRDEENVQSLLLDNLSDDAKEQIRQQVWNKTRFWLRKPTSSASSSPRKTSKTPWQALLRKSCSNSHR